MRVLCIHQEPGSRLASLEAPVRERGHELVAWQADAAPAPPADDVGAVIALGGAPHPDQEDRHPWLSGELELLRRLAADGVPILGICLGAQLVARSHDAPVVALDRSEIGWFEVRRSGAADPLLDGFPARFAAFQWHEYGFGAPAPAVVLAGSARAPHQAVRFGEAAWALQFHLEVDEPVVREWVDAGAAELARHGLDGAAIRADTARELPAYRRLAHDLGHRFLALAEARLAASA